MTHSFFTSSLDDFLSLPPLQDPFPSYGPVLSRRPSPLEPRPDDHIKIDAKPTGSSLTGRQKALAEAKPLGSGGAGDLEAALGEQEAQPEKSRKQQPAPPDPEQARKKARLGHNEQIADFVHLPKLQSTKPKDESKPPFRPVPVLVQLNEPPPSARLLPPITPRAAQNQEIQERSSLGDVDASQGAHVLSGGHAKTSPASQEPKPKKKKVYLRDRTKWTLEETEQLVKGVAIYGMGRWKDIVQHPEFRFHPSRTHVDLKDKFRVLFPRKAPQKWVYPMPESVYEKRPAVAKKKPVKNNSQRAPKRTWSESEDLELEKGFHMHGYRWELMAKDPNLTFDNRTGAQIRDRFRLRFPELYAQEAAPLSETSELLRASESTANRNPTGAKAGKNRKDGTSKKDENQDVNRKSDRSSDSFDARDDEGAFSFSRVLMQDPYGIDDMVERSTAAVGTGTRNVTLAGTSSIHTSNNTMTAGLVGTTPLVDWPTSVLNTTGAAGTADGHVEDDSDMRLTNALSPYGWGSVDTVGGGVGTGTTMGSLTLPPLNWEDLVPSPMFDIS